MNKAQKEHILLRILKVIGFILLAIIPMTLSSFLVTSDKNLPLWGTILLTLLILCIDLTLIWFMYRKYKKYSGHGIKKLTLKTIGLIILFAIFARALMYGLTVLRISLLGEKMTKNDQAIMGFDYQNTSMIAMLLFVLTLSFITPILEELAFRGIFYNKVFKYGSFILPLVITSLVFGSFHMPSDILSLIIYASLGALLIIIYRKTENILASMILHMINNLLPASMLFIMYLNGVSMTNLM
ncbi:CPBP family intramembrane glutamic endopeptidase [Staphylococcus massiliensis]|uniref:CAAX prenyl protease 2/Lysostaphin resistance protein A-like domain-containing protein n=1 Tax=Staphylococcus massiliensis S46 TaxID=1229783 RepID=K9AVE3_9STAP|nr:type II CAAX endopeptidase family protein [Staphylococcus massiliensis]EKU50096.1 hypothetical protein C273_02468 [Staphylococcus massiliensis S46]MCG3402199.1 CPBP family intramembrane metalloprotease [Staphylococcus massiliensis]MCG3412834.1 CPBP family intramembrane metalloprotease [Staphylococcus massiliensis]PNZ97452.1 CPBP family intramembrane metalloprotease [Staphylococcus massiliensis CCUG 55927]